MQSERNFKIALLTIDALPLVEEIENKSSLIPWSRKLIEEEFLCSSSRVFGAFKDECLVGFLILRLESTQAHILNLGVSSSARRLGIGRALTEASISCAIMLGVREVLLEVRESNQIAISLYLSSGFKAVGKRTSYYSDTGEDAVLMTKEVFEEERCTER